ncbi:tetratricopeptide repeat protein [Aerosakkonemataceae cyanobacterium BLCC-F50]|uniref:Tetratricopeptide repeat protein n=1 Tax=Floridaenema flaviceps BLCC-F50 TaxID=3153642 RepID=A0ABV4Y2P3_9CYAN
MKNHLFLAKLTLLGMALITVDATAQPKPQLVTLTVSTGQIIAQKLSPLERRELQILRQERQKFQQETQIRNLVQTEVDRAFSRTTTLITILLLVIILFPVAMALGLWLLRRSIINQLIGEIQQELQTEVAKQTATFKQEMEQLQSEYINYYSPLQTGANYYPDVADNLVTETSENQQFVNSGTQDFMTGETQILMAQDQYEISNLTHNEPIEPELNHSQTEVLTVEDYLNLGNSYLARSRYQEAIDAYNAALKLDRNLPEVRYQNAKAYALRGSINPAIGNLQWAIDLDPQYKQIAQTDPAFAYIRNDEQFQQLVND